MSGKLNNLKLEWLVLVLGSVLGVLSSFIQLIERINYADNPATSLACNINSVLSCSTVFDGWQSSVFGFSNSIICLTFFSIMLGVALSGKYGTKISYKLRLLMHLISLFFLVFGAWYLYQSAFSIGALCLFCTFCYIGVVSINWSWLRINFADIQIINNKKFIKAKEHGLDTFLWALWLLIISGMFVFALI